MGPFRCGFCAITAQHVWFRHFAQHLHLQMLKFGKFFGAGFVATRALCSSRLDEPLRQRIQDYITKDPVVVFMKGTHQEPMCGFSRNVKLVSLPWLLRLTLTTVLLKFQNVS